MTLWPWLALAALLGAALLLVWRHGRPGVLAHELPWAGMIAAGVVLNKAGTLTAAWRLKPRDLARLEPAERASVSAVAHRALEGLDERWMWHVDVIRRRGARYGEGSAFPDAATALLDEERRAAFGAEARLFETAYVLALTWAPPSRSAGWAERWFVSGGRRPDASGELVERFETRAGALAQALSAAIELERLDSAQLAGHLRECVSGVAGPLLLPDPPFYLDAYLSLPDVGVGHEPVIGDAGVTVLSIDHEGLPPRSEPALFRFLVDLPLEFRWSLRWLPLSRPQARREAERAEARWYQGRRSFRGQLAQYSTDERTRADLEKTAARGALTMAEEASKVAALVGSGLVGGGYASIALLVREADAERRGELVRGLERRLVAAGFGSRRERDGAFEVFLGSLPGNSTANVRWPFVHTVNLTHFLPLHAPYLGEPGPESPFFERGAPPLFAAWTAGGSAYRGSLHVGGVGHAMVVGPTGRGKSVLLGFLAASWLRYPDARVFYFDKGASQRVLCAACGGAWSDLAADGGAHLAPLAEVDRAAERDWALAWLAELCTVAREGAGLAVRERERLARALDLLARAPRRERTLTTLVTLVQDGELRRLLSAYARPRDGAPPTLAQAILDGAEESLGRSHFELFEVERLLARGPEVAVPVLRCLFHRVERSLDPTRPTLVLVDEAWAALGYGSGAGELGAFGRQLVEWALTLRKRNAALVLATQNLQHLTGLAQVEGMRENLPTWVYLPNERATGAAAEHYAALGLNALERRAVAEGRARCDYYWVQSRGGQTIELRLGAVGLALLAAQPHAGEVEPLMAADPEGWFSDWLEQRGAPIWAARHRALEETRQEKGVGA